MKNLKVSSMLGLLLVGGAMVLASCGDNPTPVTSSTAASSSQAAASSSQGGASSSSQGGSEAEGFSGAIDLSQEDWHTKSKITAALERYTMENFTGGIPLYDDASQEAFSQRVTPKSTTYITNYGFGVMEGTMDTSDTATMYNGPIDEPREAYKNYFHSYTNTDSGTFNGWDSTGADVSDRMSMITSGYFGVEMNATKDGYKWIGELSRDAYPVMLTPTSYDEDGNPAAYKETYFSDETSSEEDLAQTSVYWRVYLHVGAGYTYEAVEGSKWANTAFNGREVAIEDYITPFKAMLDNRLSRYANLITDASGFYKASDYVYNSNSSKTWENSGIGIQVNTKLSAELKDSGYGVIDFHFIEPKAANSARTNLSSSLYSPIPQEFLTAIGGAKNFGTKAAGNDGAAFNNFLCFGPYTPVEWQQGSEIVYKLSDTYYGRHEYSFEGYVETVFSGDDADEQAWKAFKANKLDNCTIPVSALKDHEQDTCKNYPTKGSTIIKINLNTTTEEEWNYFFGPNGKVKQHSQTADEITTNNWGGHKDIMSNHDFLMGFFFAVNRQALAQTAGRNPAIAYLSDAYMIDPTGTKSYRESEDGKSVTADWVELAGNEYCYNTSIAGEYFHAAGQALIDSGEWSAGEVITIEGLYRYTSTIKNLGNFIKTDVADTFNKACKDLGLTLKIDLKVGGTSYTDTYTQMDNGEFDFAEGAISGNVLDPLNFMDTCSSTSSLNQGFCLNWGHPTDQMSEYPARFDVDGDGEEENFAYDALWNASQSFTIVENGVGVELGGNQRFVFPGEADPLEEYFEEVPTSKVIFLMDYPDAARDDDGQLFYEFAIDECAIFPQVDGAQGNSGYYFDAKLISTDNGYVIVEFDADTLIDDCKRVAGSSHKATGMTLQFYLVYTLYPNDPAKRTIKTMVVLQSVQFPESFMAQMYGN